MVHIPLRWLLPCGLPAALLAFALTARAEPDAKPAASTAALPVKPDPLDPKARAPALTYGSAFSQYRRLGDPDPVSWREANDTVTRIGGWRAYAREAQQPEPTAQGQGGRKTP